LANDTILLSSLGQVVTIQIDLVGVEYVKDLLQEYFNDSEGNGIFIDNMILQRVLEERIYDYHEIFEKIVEITGDFDCIEAVTALIRIQYNNHPIEITLQLTGNTRGPQLLQVTDQSIYFPLMNLIQTRWAMATKML